jgi:DNA repair exonuclease SbcCD ATPase subunit
LPRKATKGESDMEYQTAINTIEACSGFDDNTTMGGEAWEAVRAEIDRLKAENARLQEEWKSELEGVNSLSLHCQDLAADVDRLKADNEALMLDTTALRAEIDEYAKENAALRAEVETYHKRWEVECDASHWYKESLDDLACLYEQIWSLAKMASDEYQELFEIIIATDDPYPTEGYFHNNVVELLKEIIGELDFEGQQQMELRAKLAKYKEALEWYGDEKNYLEIYKYEDGSGPVSNVQLNRGQQAREALK